MLLKGDLFQGLNMNEGNIEIVILLRIMGNHIVIALKKYRGLIRSSVRFCIFILSKKLLKIFN